MQIPRSADTDEALTNEVYDEAVDFYHAYLSSIKNLFIDNEDEDINLVVLDLDMHSEDAFASLKSMPPLEMFDADNVARIIDREVRIYNLVYTDEDIATIKQRITAHIRCQRDNIFEGAVRNYIDELENELSDLEYLASLDKAHSDLARKNRTCETTEAKGEWTA